MEPEKVSATFKICSADQVLTKADKTLTSQYFESMIPEALYSQNGRIKWVVFWEIKTQSVSITKSMVIGAETK